MQKNHSLFLIIPCTHVPGRYVSAATCQPSHVTSAARYSRMTILTVISPSCRTA